MNNNKQACFYCGKFYVKIPRHLESKHSGEDEIIKLKTLRDKKERKKILNKMRLAGNYHHNINVLKSGSGDLKVCRISRKQNVRPLQYIPCVNCLGFYFVNDLWRHEKKCKFAQKCTKDILKKGKSLLLSIICPNTDRYFISCVLSSMHLDKVAELCQTDDLILKFGETLFQKKGSLHADTVRRKMRKLGCLLLQLHKQTRLTKSLRQFIRVEHFDIIVEAVKCISQSDVDTEDKLQKPDKPSVSIQIGFLLKKCASIKLGDAIRAGDTTAREQARNFLKLYKSEWQDKVLSVALETLFKRRNAKPYAIPLTEDIQSLRQFLIAHIPLLMVALQREKTPNNYRNLAEVTLTRIVMFNRRRSGEASRMLLTDYTGRHKWSDAYNAEIASAMTELERHLCKT